MGKGAWCALEARCLTATIHSLASNSVFAPNTTDSFSFLLWGRLDLVVLLDSHVMVFKLLKTDATYLILVIAPHFMAFNEGLFKSKL